MASSQAGGLSPGRLDSTIGPSFNQRSLPDDVLYYEIFPQLSPTNIYSYCQSSRDKVRLCNNVDFWANYLAEMTNDEIQRLVIDESENNNFPFIKIMLEHEEELYVLIDERTKLKSYYLFADQKNWNAVDYLSNKIEYRYGIPKNNDLKGLWSMIDSLVTMIAQNVRQVQQSLNNVDNNSDEILNVYGRMIKTRVDHEYLTTQIVESLSPSTTLRYIDIHIKYSSKMSSDKREFINELFGASVRTLVSTDINSLEQFLKKSSQLLYRSSILNHDKVIENLSYDLYLKLERYIDTDPLGCPYDLDLWQYLYDKAQEDTKEILLVKAFRVMEVDDWLAITSTFDSDDQYLIIGRALKNAQLEGYTLWTRQLEEKIDMNPLLLPERHRFRYIVWKPTKNPKKCFVSLESNPKAALMLCPPNTKINRSYVNYYLGSAEFIDASDKLSANRCNALADIDWEHSSLFIYIENSIERYQSSRGDGMYYLFSSLDQLKERIKTVFTDYATDGESDSEISDQEAKNTQDREMALDTQVDEILPDGKVHFQKLEARWALIVIPPA